MTSTVTPEQPELIYKIFPEYQQYCFQYKRPVLRTKEQLEQLVLEELFNEFNCGIGAKRYMNQNITEEEIDLLWNEFRQVNYPLKAAPCYVVLQQNTTYTEYTLTYLSPTLTSSFQEDCTITHPKQEVNELLNLIRHESRPT